VRHSRSGLTLVEVLLAVAILGAGLTVLLTGAARCLVVMRNAKQYQRAQWAMKMGELEHPLIVSNDLEDLEVTGETYDHDFTFTREVDEEEESDDDGLFVVRTRVTWSDKGSEMKDEVVQYIYSPDNKKAK
jgi:prepilin-type N-terminal cleavage/methylation domain-containing protein